MGRCRKRVIEQSVKKKHRTILREREWLWSCSADKPNYPKKETLFLPVHLHASARAKNIFSSKNKSCMKQDKTKR